MASRDDRTRCRTCRTRYDTSALPPGTIFTCRHCGAALFAPGERPDTPERGGAALVRLAQEAGLCRVAAAEEAMIISLRTGGRRRPAEVLLEREYLSGSQLTRLLSDADCRVIHFIPGYDLLNRLGEGAMGMVYKGIHLPSGKTVAVKVLSARLSTRPVFLERFHREARVAIDLDHPNIVKGFDEGEAGGVHYFVMEYVHGKSVKRVLKKRGRFGERRAMDITRQVAAALEYAHGQGVVHRDVKPDNIMLTRDGLAKLADYGLVKHLEAIELADLTDDGQMLGTPNYVSPEQARGAARVDIRSDIYSLGATLYHMLTGEPPFTGASSAEVLCKHATETPGDPRRLNPQLTEEAVRIVMALLAKKPEDRPATPARVGAMLAEYFARRPATTETSITTRLEELTGLTFGPNPPSIDEDEDDDFDPRGVARGASERLKTRQTGALLLGLALLSLLVGIGLAVRIVLAWPKGGGPRPANGEAAPLALTGSVEMDREAQLAEMRLKQSQDLPPVQREAEWRQIARLYPDTPAGRECRRRLAER